MITNLTNLFREAIDNSLSWRSSSFFLALKRFRSSDINFSFWQGEENWVSIIIDNKVKGYMWSRYPIVFVEKDVADNIRKCLISIDTVVFLEVDSLCRDVFKIDLGELSNHLEYFSNADAFTAEDLWFYTNSA